MNNSTNTSFRNRCSQYWNFLQGELLPSKAIELEGLTPTLERIIRVLEWVRVEQYVMHADHVGRPTCERTAMARAYCVKAVLGMQCTAALRERLSVDSKLRRICGFSAWHKLPSESTFSRAFAQFAKDGIADKAHAAMVQAALSGHIIGAISRDSTAIVARETPAKPKSASGALPTTENCAASAVTKPKPNGRPPKCTTPAPAVLSIIQTQRLQSTTQIIAQLPAACAYSAKTNAKGYKESWHGYKLHLDTTDCGVTVSALTTSASLHDSQAAIALSRLSTQKVTYLYELADAAYCSDELRAYSLSLGHVPLFDHNPRGGVKRVFESHEAHWYKARSGAERPDALLKDCYGLRQVWVQGHCKVHAHLMFAVLVMSAEQLMRLIQ